ncbi:MAG: hypothetical protein DRJ01_04100 [Bacteroidetes bacterium]|nr:MAG: hypothetical protein DRJ01_04100 [Bacteroidota bacterium]
MKNVKLTSLLLVLFFAFSTNGFSQESWGLQKCINYALDNNIQIKKQKLNSEISENNLKQSKYNLLPSLNGSASHSFSFGKTADMSSYQYVDQKFQSGNMALQAQVNLFNGLRDYNAVKQNEFNLLASLQDVEKAKNDISLNIVSAYLQILFNKEALSNSENELEITKQQVERTKKLVDAGNLAKGSLLEIISQQATEKVSVINNKNQLNMSYLTLTQMLDLDSIGNFEIEVPELSISNIGEIPVIDTIYAQAENNFPQIKSAKYRMKGSEKNLLISKGQRYPQLSLRGSYYSRYSELAKDPLDPTADYSYKDQLGDYAGSQISFSLSIPIFNKFAVKTSVDNAKISLLSAKYDYDLTKQQVYKDIQQAISDANAALESYQARKEALVSMEESFKYTQQKFNLGLVNSLDFNTSKNNLNKAKSDLLQAKYQYIFKLKILDFYQGKQIQL